MIKLGFPKVGIYPNNGIVIENAGTVIFEGKCTIGNDSFIAVGPKATLSLGVNFGATCSLKIVAWNYIKFGDNVLIGWENLFSDTDFHSLVTPEGKITKQKGRIIIGNNNWFAMKCVVLKDTITSNYTSVGACSLLNKDYSNLSYCFICGAPAKLKKSGYYYDITKDEPT